ncbi:uncharacterized protein [Nicotiana tomentosiformis]|uniref:uncharacterized protein n=1 Tax=Nicotiana tomentosiformis TaxID=4098 RepID=UPI00388CE971
MGVIGPIAPYHMYPGSHGFQANARCKYHSGVPWHSTDDCWTLKKAIERLIAEKLIVVTNDEDSPNVINNSFPTHNDVHFKGIIVRDQEYKPMLKFEHDRQGIIVHGEDESFIYKDRLIPCIEAKEGCESIIYQDFEVVTVDHVEEGKPILHPRLSATSIMVAALMLRQGYETGKGLGRHCKEFWNPFLPLVTRVLLVYISGEDKQMKTKPSIAKAWAGEGTSRADMQLIGPDTMLNNWEATHLRTSKESCLVNAGFNNMTCMRNSRSDLKKLSNFKIMHQEVEYDEDGVVEEIKRELEQFENKPKPNLNETKLINIGSREEVREIKISIHTEQKSRDALIQLLFEYRDVFSWSYDDMPDLSADLMDAAIKWMDDCQKAFDMIKDYLSKPPVLVPPEPGRTLFLYLSVMDNSFGCVLGQHNATCKKEHAIYYLSKKFTNYENGSFEVHLPKANVHEQDRKMANSAHRVRHHLCHLHRNESPCFRRSRQMGDSGPQAYSIKKICARPKKKIQVHQVQLRCSLMEIQVQNQHGYYNIIEIEPDGELWYHDIKRFLKAREYSEHAKGDKKRTIRRIAGGFFLNREILYKRTLDLNLLRCIDAIEAKRIMSEVHSGVFRPHMNGYVFGEEELHLMSSPWPFVACGMDVIGLIEPKASNGSRFILVAIDYCTKPLSLNASNLNSHLMKEVCEQYKIMHHHYIPYRPKANGAVEMANKNIKKILRKMIQGMEAVISAEVKIPSLRISVESEIKDTEYVKTLFGITDAD